MRTGLHLTLPTRAEAIRVPKSDMVVGISQGQWSLASCYGDVTKRRSVQAIYVYTPHRRYLVTRSITAEGIRRPDEDRSRSRLPGTTRFGAAKRFNRRAGRNRPERTYARHVRFRAVLLRPETSLPSRPALVISVRGAQPGEEQASRGPRAAIGRSGPGSALLSGGRRPRRCLVSCLVRSSTQGSELQRAERR